jgi:hypothetical protein
VTPLEHVAEAERQLRRAAAVENTPRTHLTKSFALAAIGHAVTALARCAVDTGTTPGAYGVTTYSRVAAAVERIAHDAAVHVLPSTVRCPGCDALTDSGGVRASDGHVWCIRCAPTSSALKPDTAVLEGRS